MPNQSRAARGGGEGGEDSEIVLGVLTAVEHNSNVTQRSVARQLGIALGLANAYLKRCARKGLIKVSHVPARRYAYYLTPHGFTEKTRLTARYLASSFAFFRAARQQCAALLAAAAARGWSRLALAGAGDLAEIATLCARDTAIELVGIVDPGAEVQTLAGLAVVASLDRLAAVDAVIVTDLRSPQATFEAISAVIGPARVLAPPILGVTPNPPVEAARAAQ
ncbi:MAG: winged helix-turn-helix transcriptional regulator [Pseudomonadota bacterium]